MGRDPVRNPPPAPPESAAVRVEYTLVLTEEVAGTHGSDLATVRPGRKQDLLQPQLGSSARASATVTVLHSLVSYGWREGTRRERREEITSNNDNSIPSVSLTALGAAQIHGFLERRWLLCSHHGWATRDICVSLQVSF